MALTVGERKILILQRKTIEELLTTSALYPKRNRLSTERISKDVSYAPTLNNALVHRWLSRMGEVTMRVVDHARVGRDGFQMWNRWIAKRREIHLLTKVF